ncbi:MAG: acetate--CoA ligase family protein [Flavobacteriaceae bacterium]|nr:acetate--CoA ligase family protein [Flavobacteriaceae bacterium]
MLHQKFINPESIVVVGGSDNIQSPGGRVLKNLIDHNYQGKLLVVNPKQEIVQGIKSYTDATLLPNVDVAIIAIAAKFCVETVRVLTQEKNTKGFIIFSAGFSEKDEEGAQLEHEIVQLINKAGGTLLGPNNIGIINQHYTGVFTTPIPKLDSKGVDLISGSGATAVFIIEAAMASGLTFSSIYSVGNSAQIGVEEVIEHMDKTFNPSIDSKIKLLYIESINNPQKLLKHASSLIQKGCKIAAIKAGSSDAGSRAASSHTGALANSDVAVDALFRKAGIVRCYGRMELINVASVFMHPELKGKKIAIITHAGGPAVMLTDALSKNGLEVPSIEGEKAEDLLTKLFPGSSITNPIDFLATGTAEQLGHIIDACENDFEDIDAMAVIFGSPGLFKVFEVYDLLHQKMLSCKKPIFPILPSVVNVKEEIDYFLTKGRINFPDEVQFGKALAKVFFTPKPNFEDVGLEKIDVEKIRKIIDNANNGYLHPDKVQQILKAANIPVVQEKTVYAIADAIKEGENLKYPLVMKVVGPVHKSDVGGVVLNITSEVALAEAFESLMLIKDAEGVLIQQMKKGMELFIGAKRESGFGHMVLCGMGGVFIEVLKDTSVRLAPISEKESKEMVHNLKAFPILKGIRNQQGIDINAFAQYIRNISTLVTMAPEIAELDLNPLLGNSKEIIAVDARILIEKY